MAVSKIGTQHGLEARRVKENEFHPGIAAWDKSAETFKTLVTGHNETIDKLAAIEGQLANPPFPFRDS